MYGMRKRGKSVIYHVNARIKKIRKLESVTRPNFFKTMCAHTKTPEDRIVLVWSTIMLLVS